MPIGTSPAATPFATSGFNRPAQLTRAPRGAFTSRGVRVSGACVRLGAHQKGIAMKVTVHDLDTATPIMGLVNVEWDNALVQRLTPSRPLATLAVGDTIRATDRLGARYVIIRLE